MELPRCLGCSKFSFKTEERNQRHGLFLFSQNLSLLEVDCVGPKLRSTFFPKRLEDVQQHYPQQVVPAGGFDALHELIYLDELAVVGPGGWGLG